MCLITRQLCPIKAKKPITVYKVVREKLEKDRYGNKKYTYYSPIRGMHITLNSQIVAEGPIMPEEFYQMRSSKYYYPVYSYYNSSKHVGKGFIHCFTNILCAKNMCTNLSHNRIESTFRIIECIIEPGTLYYKSQWESPSEICARSLTTKGIVY